MTIVIDEAAHRAAFIEAMRKETALLEELGGNVPSDHYEKMFVRLAFPAAFLVSNLVVEHYLNYPDGYPGESVKGDTIIKFVYRNQPELPKELALKLGLLPH